MPKSFPKAELEAAVGAAPVERRRVRSAGYGTNSAHWRVALADGRRAFVKVALDDNAAEWLRQEHHVYSAVEAPFIPELVGWHDGEQTLLAITDLSEAYWPPPWTPRRSTPSSPRSTNSMQRRRPMICLPSRPSANG